MTRSRLTTKEARNLTKNTRSGNRRTSTRKMRRRRRKMKKMKMKMKMKMMKMTMTMKMKMRRVGSTTSLKR